MRMPEEMPDALLAPCGIACVLCHHHCREADPCPGCREGQGHSSHCRLCALRRCAADRGLLWCAQCSEFSCAPLTAFNEFYRRTYGFTFLQNADLMRSAGREAMVKRLTHQWRCPDCGGVICIHDGLCSECGRPMAT